MNSLSVRVSTNTQQRPGRFFEISLKYSLKCLLYVDFFYEDFFMHMHMFCFKALQKTDFFKVVFVEKMSFLQKNSI